jgi:hypothetical protein
MDLGWEIGKYGAITVMFPAAMVVAAWLWAAAGWRACLQWLLTLLSAYLLVALSKILFKGWGISFPALDIAVLSGHAMNTSLVVIVAASLLARQIKTRWRWPAATLATAWGVWFAATCVAPGIHPLAEALAGSLVGSLAAWAFLRRLERFELETLAPAAVGVGLALVVLVGSLPKYNAERYLNDIAVKLSGAERPHLIPVWRAAPGS